MLVHCLNDVSCLYDRFNVSLNIRFQIDPKPCNPRTLQKPKRSGGFPKVFLGGLPSNVTETDLRSFFTRFGKVMEVVIMYDQEKKKSRGEFLFRILSCWWKIMRSNRKSTLKTTYKLHNNEPSDHKHCFYID